MKDLENSIKKNENLVNTYLEGDLNKCKVLFNSLTYGEKIDSFYYMTPFNDMRKFYYSLLNN